MRALRKINLATNSRIEDEFTNYKILVINKIEYQHEFRALENFVFGVDSIFKSSNFQIFKFSNYRVKRSSLYFGSGHISLSIINSNLSIL